MTTSRIIFVTGATGFIGSRLVPRLLKRGHTVKALVRHPEQAGRLRALGVQLQSGDVTRPDGLAEGMRGADWLLHLANHYSLHERDESIFAHVNVQGNRNVMQAALDAAVEKVVHISSGVSYGVSPDQPLREDSRVGPHPNAYWRTKHAGDEVVQSFKDQGLPVVTLYPGAVVGPGDPNATGQWIRRLVRQRQVLRAFEGSGFTFVHVEDVAEAIVRAAEREDNVGERYLIGQEYLTNRAFVELVAELSGRPMPPIVLPDRLAHASAAFLEKLEKWTGLPPLLGFTGNSARHLAAGFRFGSSKAKDELGLMYTPVRQAVAEDIATLTL
ncbi:dihydroflavonol-4-reductase [Deinococcus aerolatus]|uniref:Dihydroflavonol-4-reductase n=1 Tax=Deinococcus aerolatus TaxID=522487 RepID=A0ABQ2GCI5_9DEIO|nr:NAD-dependent epimerase/dehydratase family protein [Deinococcus aerolatus]GGL86282.1 dihydroflavonol-4-reductase [Deinococcus aerolatus]